MGCSFGDRAGRGHVARAWASARGRRLAGGAALALALAACRPADVQPRAAAAADADAEGAPPRETPPATEDAAPSAGTDAAPDASLDASLDARALPPVERLLAPFRGTRARGFVAMTQLDPRAPKGAQRASSAWSAGAALDLDRPVLLASFTKLVTAVAALRLVERGELSLDDTVRDVLPALAGRPWARSTLRELLTHTSLVPEFDEQGGYYRKVDVDFRAPVAALAQHVPRGWSEKRGIYKYRNAELALVGALLAARSQLPAEAVLAREVWGPAGMTHAGLLVTKGPPDLALGAMGAIRPQNFFTAGAAYASAADLLSFFEALLGGRLLGPASLSALFLGDPGRGYGALGCWAYPFALPDGGTTLLVERPGSFGDVRLFAALFPDQRRAVVAWTGDGVDLGRPRAARGTAFALARAALE